MGSGDVSSEGARRDSFRTRFVGVLCLVLVVWSASPGFSATFDPSFYEEQRQEVIKYLSAEEVQGRVGEVLVVTSKLPADVKEADFILEAQVVSPEGQSDLEVSIEGREVRLKAAKAGQFVVAVVGIRPTPNSM